MCSVRASSAFSHLLYLNPKSKPFSSASLRLRHNILFHNAGPWKTSARPCCGNLRSPLHQSNRPGFCGSVTGQKGSTPRKRDQLSPWWNAQPGVAPLPVTLTATQLPGPAGRRDPGTHIPRPLFCEGGDRACCQDELTCGKFFKQRLGRRLWRSWLLGTFSHRACGCASARPLPTAGTVRS